VKQIAAGLFDTKGLAVMDEVQAKHEFLVITKHDKPMAKLVPVTSETVEIYNFLVRKGTDTGDFVSPAISPKECGDRK
jgi:antitoxin (DNA-binding transcriptional repressor) of toxin-antitoxin stability system